MAGTGHRLIVGATRMGKSRMVLKSIIKSFDDDEPIIYLDPKEDTYRALLAWFCTEAGKKVWDKYRHRIRLINPSAKCGYVYGCNVLKSMGEFKNHTVDPVALVASSITSHIRKQAGYDVGEAARMQQIMESAIGLLTAEGLALTELTLLFQQEKVWSRTKNTYVNGNPLNAMVRQILPRVEHFATKLFWEEIYPNWTGPARQEWPASTYNKIFQYLFNERIMCHLNADTGFDPQEIINERMWLFVNLNESFLTDTLVTMMGNLIISKIYYACMQRPLGSPAMRMIIDEAGMFNTGPLDIILNKAGSGGLWLTLVVQSLNQMCRSANGALDYKLRNAVITNASQISCFGTNDLDDTTNLSRIFFPITGTVVLNEADNKAKQYLAPTAEEEKYRGRIVNLQNRQVIVYQRGQGAAEKYEVPYLALPAVPDAQLDMLESEHLMLTGVSTKEARDEIDNRRRYWKELITRSQAQPTTQKKFSMGS